MIKNINGSKQQKAPTKGEIERRMRDALVLVPKDKDYRSVTFIDKGLKLEVTQDFCCIKTGYHTHVFDAVTSNGYSRPYLYISRFIDFAKENDCEIFDKKGNFNGHSYHKLFDALKSKDDKTEFNIATYVDWYLSNIFTPLYRIDENAATQFITYFDYLSNIASQHIFLKEHKEGMTNKEFVEAHNELMNQFLENLEENQIFIPLSDEDRLKQEMEALAEQEQEAQNEKEDGAGED